MDERELRDRANELHDYLVGVEGREAAAEKRHKELIDAIGELTRSFDRLADAFLATSRR